MVLAAQCRCQRRFYRCRVRGNRQHLPSSPTLSQISLRTRRLVLHRFPFSIVYLDKADVVNIVAVAHSKRKPGIGSGACSFRALHYFTRVAAAQPGALKLLILVRHVTSVPLCGVVKYSFTYQNVQSSTGSTVMLV